MIQLGRIRDAATIVRSVCFRARVAGSETRLFSSVAAVISERFGVCACTAFAPNTISTGNAKLDARLSIDFPPPKLASMSILRTKIPHREAVLAMKNGPAAKIKNASICSGGTVCSQVATSTR